MEKRKRKYRFLRRTARILAVLVVLFLVLVLFVRSPWGQDVIVSEVTNYISDKTNTEVIIDKLYVGFSGTIILEGLYLEDKAGDTLVYSRTLEADVPLRPLLFSNELHLKSLSWNGLRANVSRAENTEDFNFSFLIDALVPQDTIAASNTSEPMAIRVGRIDVSEIDLAYTDGFLGLKSSLKLGMLNVKANEIDLNTLHFQLDEVRFADTQLEYVQTKPFAADTDAGESDLPFISVRELILDKVSADYSSIPDAISAQVAVGQLHVASTRADLSQNVFETEKIALENSVISIAIPKATRVEKDTTKTKTIDGFEWPEYHINAADIAFRNNWFNYSVGKTNPETGQFHAEAMAFSNIRLAAKSLAYAPKDVALEVQQFSFTERSGFQLRDLQFSALLDDNKASLTKLKLRTGNSSLHGNASASYASFDAVFDRPETVELRLAIPNFSLSMDEAFLFAPQLRNNSYATTLATYPLTGNSNVTGNLQALQIADTEVNWGENTSIKGKMTLNNSIRPDSLSFDNLTVMATTARIDVLRFVSETALGISVPETLVLDVDGKGSLQTLTAQAELRLPKGSIALTGNYDSRKEHKFNGKVTVDGLRLDALLNNPLLGGLAFTADLTGGGRSISTLDARLETDFSTLEVADYDFSNLELNGKLTNGNGGIKLSFEDEYLHFGSDIQVSLDSIAPTVGLNFHLIGADLYALGLTDAQIKAAMDLKADFKGNTSDFTLHADTNNGLVVYDNKQYPVDDIRMDLRIAPQRTNFSVNSDFLNGALSSNTTPKRITKALTEKLKNYFKDRGQNVSVSDSVRVNMNLSLRPNPILTEVFFRGTEQLDSLTVAANFDALTQELEAKAHLPYAKYSGSSVDSLTVSLNGDSTDLNFSAGFSKLLAGPIQIKKTALKGQLMDKKLQLGFVSTDKGEKLVNMEAELGYAKDSVQLRIRPENLILNSQNWSVPPNNEIVLATDHLAFHNVVLSRKTQELRVGNTMEGVNAEHLGFNFSNFRIQTFLSLFNPDTELANGAINGNLVIENPSGATGLVADFKVDGLTVLNAELGNLAVNASSVAGNAYDFKLDLIGNGADLDLTGNYTAAEAGAQLNLDLDMNRLEMSFLERFTEGELTSSKGYLSGQVKLSGTTAAPEYTGVVNFNSVGFNVSSINADFQLSEERIRLDSDGIYLNNFVISDENNNSFTLDGTIGTANLANPTFDLQLDTEKFRLLNSTKDDNELFYGTASLDADIAVKGNLQLPEISGRMRIREVTDLTYVVPESQLDVEEREGVVIFVNRENTDAILTRKDEEERSTLFKGMDVQAILEIADDAVFNIIIDEHTGDNLKVSGNADLNLNIEPNGRINLSGRYELSSGHYEASLYNLVNRRFQIKTGSSITWNGSPTDAALDVTAIYDLETSAAPLMASVTSGQDASVAGKYRQVLPFKVYLNVDGELLAPELSFGLDMPEDDQGALGGAVYAQVQQLNQEEAQLNKQVFSLLALNRFYPDAGSDGSAGGTANFARDNVNDLLSGELNTFSDKLLGDSGFELDFDLDSFTDYQGDNPQDRTQLNINASKKLFNDRLIVSAGSAVDIEGSAQPGQDETPIIGNVSLEYLLTRDGHYRLRGFRKNQYENIIDGQLIVTGVALILNREFNKFSQLFNPLKEASPEGTGTQPKNKKQNK